MNTLLRNIRPLILVSTVIIAVGIYLVTKIVIPSGSLQIIRITQVYALTAVVYLYFSLLASPLKSAFPNLSVNKYLIKARKATGVSAFIFALLHACFAFFGQLGGFQGLGFLSSSYLIAISLSFIALLILSIMTVTSFKTVIAMLSHTQWKFIHRFVYAAGILIMIHALLLGTHFSNATGTIYRVFSAAIIILFILEAMRIDLHIAKKFQFAPRYGVFFIVTVSTIIYIFFHQTHFKVNTLFNIHSKHLQDTTDSQTMTHNSGSMNMQGMDGDASKRFTVDFNHEESIYPNRNTVLHFQVYDEGSGKQVLLFSKLYEKLFHLIIVDNELDYYHHIHSEDSQNGFTVTTQFPHAGQYRLYTDFQPLGAIEQQFAFTVTVGDKGVIEKKVYTPDKTFSKTFGSYRVDFDSLQPLRAVYLSHAMQKLSFTLYNANTNEQITTLKPYLGAYGHLVMINVDTYEYIHVHPVSVRSPAPDENGGPTVEFTTMNLNTKVKPGIYRIFAQFNPDNHLFTADFTIKVE